MNNVMFYDEKDIGSSAGLNHPGMKLELDCNEQLTFTDAEQKGLLAYYNLDNNGKKAEKLKNDGSDGFGTIFTYDAGNNLYSLFEKNGEYKEGDKNREVTYKLNIFDPNGKKQRSIDLGKMTLSMQQAGITDIAADSKGNVYVLLRRDHIKVFGADGKKIKDIADKNADYIEVDEADNLIIGSFGENNQHGSIIKRSLDKEKIWSKDLDTGNYIKEMKYNLKAKKLYMFTDKGVLVCSADGIMEGYIFDMKQTSLIESAIYTCDFAVDSNKNIYILAFKSDVSSGENRSIPLLYKYTPSKNQQKSKNQKTLTIALRYSERFIESAISKYQKEYPDVKVEIKDFKAAYMGTGEAEAKRAQTAEEDYKKAINTGLIAGKGYDIIDLMGMPYNKYAEKKVLASMSELIKNDKSFNVNNYQQKLLNACKYKDNLYIMPINFCFLSLNANKNILKAEGISIDDSKWTWKDFLAIAQKITKDKNNDGKPDQYALYKMTAEELFSYIYGNESSNFIDYDKKKASFDSKEFIDLLKFIKDFQSKNVSSPTLDINGLYNMTDPGTIGFMQGQFSFYQNIIMNQCLFNSDVEFLDMPTFNGKGASKSFIPYRMLGINNNSEMKAEAWDLIKILLSDEIQSSSDMYSFPVNLNALKAKAKDEITRNYMYQGYKDQYPGRNIRRLTQQDIDYVDKKIAELDCVPYSDSQVDKIVSEGVKDYFSGKKTAEEVAREIQNKTYIYLGE